MPSMGIGMVLIVAADKADAVVALIRAQQQPCWLIGEVTRGTGTARVV